MQRRSRAHLRNNRFRFATVGGERCGDGGDRYFAIRSSLVQMAMIVPLNCVSKSCCVIDSNGITSNVVPAWTILLFGATTVRSFSSARSTQFAEPLAYATLKPLTCRQFSRIGLEKMSAASATFFILLM